MLRNVTAVDAMFFGTFALIAAAVAAVAATLAWDHLYPCKRSHKEWRERGAWVQIIMAGKTAVPVVHPARAGWEDVCDER